MAYQNILVPVDGSDTSFAAVKQAAELAKVFGSKITVVQVMTLDPYIASEYLAHGQSNMLIERAREFIQDNINVAKEQFLAEGVKVETRLLEGQMIHQEIINAAKEINADLIVIGSHGRTGLKKFFLGSVAQKILGETSVPVLVVRQ